jgi:enoyl-CoA hydratase/carnithine racemase
VNLISLDYDSAIATIRLNRAPVNALNTDLHLELRAAAEEVSARADVRAVVIYGGRKVFAAGADIKELSSLSPLQLRGWIDDMGVTLDAVAAIPKPVVAAINGYALGAGCELALTADRRICAADAKLGQPEIKLGLIPGAGGTARLARLIGPSKAKDLVFTGRIVGADEALQLGLVDAVVAPEQAYAAALAWAAQFAAGPAIALRAGKDSIDRGLDADLASALEIERELFASVFDTGDRRAGVQAFLDKNPDGPQFAGS